MNGYARLPHVKAELNAQGSTAQDADILRALERASEAARTMVGGRQFHSTIETRYFSGDGNRHYLLGKDLLSVTTLKIADTADQPTTFENTLTAGTDYTLWPRNAGNEGKPYRAIVLNPAGQYGVAPCGVDNIQIVGKWGYSERLEAVVSGATAVTGTVANGSTLTITTSADISDLIFPGDTVFIESEQIEVLSIPTNLSFVGTRAINGTTGAAHSAAALYIRRYPSDIERAVSADAARFLWRAAQGYQESSFSEQWGAIRGTLLSYTDPAAVA